MDSGREPSFVGSALIALQLATSTALEQARSLTIKPSNKQETFALQLWGGRTYAAGLKPDTLSEPIFRSQYEESSWRLSGAHVSNPNPTQAARLGGLGASNSGSPGAGEMAGGCAPGRPLTHSERAEDVQRSKRFCRKPGDMIQH